MKKIIASSLAAGCILCCAGTSNACTYYDVEQVATYEWVDGTANITHEYILYKYIPGDDILDKKWDATKTWVANNASDYYLASITSDAESVAIAAIFSGLNCEIWLGASKNSNGNWAWESGETWNVVTNDWAPGEPNNAGGAENYLGMYTTSRLFNDEGSPGNICGFLVEKTSSPVPEPGTMLLLGTGLAGLAAVGRRKMK